MIGCSIGRISCVFQGFPIRGREYAGVGDRSKRRLLGALNALFFLRGDSKGGYRFDVEAVSLLFVRWL